LDKEPRQRTTRKIFFAGYVGDFGTTSVVPDRFMPTSVVYVGDNEYFSVAYLRPFQTLEMGRTADGLKRVIIAEWTLRMKSQYSWASILALT